MKRIFLSICLLSLLITSCKKETPDTETQSSVDNAICEGEFNSRMPIVNSYGIKQQGTKSNRTVYPVDSLITDTTITGSVWPRTLLIDYGPDGVMDTLNGDSKIRKGKIYITFNKRWHLVSDTTTAIVHFSNYAVSTDGGASFTQYDADRIVITHNHDYSFTTSVEGGKCTSPKWTLYWSSTRTMTQTEGGSTPFIHSDDVFEATGNSSGTDRNGKKYTVVISSPIVKRATCQWMEKGRLDLTPEGLSARTIDYGDGTCDNKAMLTINGNTFTFNMN